jgi:hypothetical protein
MTSGILGGTPQGSGETEGTEPAHGTISHCSLSCRGRENPSWQSSGGEDSQATVDIFFFLRYW